MTWLAVMVVPLVVPSTSTLSPLLTTLAELEVVPVRYLVADVSLTVTFWPVEVEIVKLDFDTLATVPDDPPAAGPDRALAAPRCPAGVAGDDADVAVPEPGLAAAPTMP